MNAKSDLLVKLKSLVYPLIALSICKSIDTIVRDKLAISSPKILDKNAINVARASYIGYFISMMRIVINFVYLIARIFSIALELIEPSNNIIGSCELANKMIFLDKIHIILQVFDMITMYLVNTKHEDGAKTFKAQLYELLSSLIFDDACKVIGLHIGEYSIAEIGALNGNQSINLIRECKRGIIGVQSSSSPILPGVLNETTIGKYIGLLPCSNDILELTEN